MQTLIEKTWQPTLRLITAYKARDVSSPRFEDLLADGVDCSDRMVFSNHFSANGRHHYPESDTNVISRKDQAYEFD